MLDKQFFGVLNLQSDKIGGISPSAQHAIEVVANRLAIAIHHATRIDELEEEQKLITDQAARLTQAGGKIG